jgi:hypothetical protein
MAKQEVLNANHSQDVTMRGGQEDTELIDIDHPFGLSSTRIFLLGASVTSANVFFGFGYHTVTVTLNQLAKDLDIEEGNLQWAANSHLLAVVSSRL